MEEKLAKISHKKKESRHDRFIRVVTKRTNDTLNKIRLLGNCSNKSGYDYSEQEINKIFGTIDRALKEARSKFHFSKNKEFKL